MIEVERSDTMVQTQTSELDSPRQNNCVSTTDPDVTPVEGRKRATESS